MKTGNTHKAVMRTLLETYMFLFIGFSNLQTTITFIHLQKFRQEFKGCCGQELREMRKGEEINNPGIKFRKIY